MGRKIRGSTHEISGPWNTPHDKKNFQSPADFYHGQKGSDVTLFCHLPPPPHAQDPKIAEAPDPYFGKEGNDVTEWIRYVDMARPASRDWYFGKPSSDVTQWLNVQVPAGPNPAGDSFWGRTKSYVTDPSVSPNMTPPGKPMDGLGTMDAMTWNSKSKDDQVPLGKSVSKIQSMLNALARSRRQAPPAKPRGERIGLVPGKRHSPGFPVGRSPKDFPPPGWTLPERKPTEWESTYWGKCKSYVTDYAMSPTLTPPGRPLLGEQAKEAMCFIPETGGREERIPLGRAVKRMGAGRPHSPTNQSPHLPLGNATRKLRPRPHLTPHPNPPPGSKSPGSTNPPSPKVPPPPKSPPKSGQASPPSPAASKCSSGSAKKAGNQANLRWRDQQQFGKRLFIVSLPMLCQPSSSSSLYCKLYSS
jgi:hypothetical protein